LYYLGTGKLKNNIEKETCHYCKHSWLSWGFF